MPTSNPALIYDVLNAAGLGMSGRLLDVGFGYGKYSFLMREYAEAVPHEAGQEYGARRLHLTGIDIWPGYVGVLQEAIFDRILVGDALEQMTILHTSGEAFDCILLCSVVEHMTPEYAERALQVGLELSPRLVVSTPNVFYEQGAVYGNPHEAHLWLVTPQSLEGAGRKVEAIRRDGQGQVFRVTRL